jgi:hypothetical protein
MNQIPKLGLWMSLVAGLAGCPIYGSSSGSGGSSMCDASNDYCNSNGTCQQDSDCSPGQYCSAYGSCVNLPSSTSSTGSGTATTSSTGTGATTSSSGTGGAPPVYCGNPSDCSASETCAPDGTCKPGDCIANSCIYGYVCDITTTPVCKPQNPDACGSDTDCAASGKLCVSGICTAPADQCFDGTQCPAGDVCAAGKCTPSCGGAQSCSGSYTCSNVGTCTVPAQACTITNDCGSASLVCVDGACVPRSTNGACDPGLVWVENGCIPDQKATFTCTVDGQQDVCASGSLCLHHSCYISCSAGPQVCSGLPTFNQCKAVTTTSGAHQVCGSSTNLGGQCDPTAGNNCSPGLICIDGFCK